MGNSPGASSGKRYALALAAYVALIFVLSRIPAVSLNIPLFPHADKLVHFVEYVPVGFLVAMWTIVTGRVKTKATVLPVVVGLVAALAAFDEFHQSFVPGRDASVFDGLADMVGGAVGGLVAAYRSNLPWRREHYSDGAGG